METDYISLLTALTEIWTSIYFADRGKSWEEWSTPIRLPSPVNDNSFDCHPWVDAESGYLYFSSNRDGSSDIFRYPLLNERLLDKELVVRGTVLDDDGTEVSSKIFYGPRDLIGSFKSFKTTTGEFEIELSNADTYLFYAERGKKTSEVVTLNLEEATTGLTDPDGITLQLSNQGLDMASNLARET